MSVGVLSDSANAGIACLGAKDRASISKPPLLRFATYRSLGNCRSGTSLPVRAGVMINYSLLSVGLLITFLNTDAEENLPARNPPASTCLSDSRT